MPYPLSITIEKPNISMSSPFIKTNITRVITDVKILHDHSTIRNFPLSQKLKEIDTLCKKKTKNPIKPVVRIKNKCIGVKNKHSFLKGWECKINSKQGSLKPLRTSIPQKKVFFLLVEKFFRSQNFFNSCFVYVYTCNHMLWLCILTFYNSNINYLR